MPLKRDFLDAAFSDLIREAHDWICAKCSRQFPNRKGYDAHCSHFVSRGAGNGLRWNIDNACLLCASCHDYLGKRPDEHTAFFRKLIGDTRWGSLQDAKRSIVKLTRQDKKDMAKHFREELKRIQELRMRGICGYIGPVPFE